MNTSMLGPPFDISKDAVAIFLAAQPPGPLNLRLNRIYRRDASPWNAPACRFDIVSGGRTAGTLSLRLGDSDFLVRYAGHVGFRVDPRFRGRRLAQQATRLVLPFAASLGQVDIWMTCDPGNAPSRRTIEALGATYVDTLPIPPHHDGYAKGAGRKRRYRLRLDG